MKHYNNWPSDLVSLGQTLIQLEKALDEANRRIEELERELQAKASGRYDSITSSCEK